MSDEEEGGAAAAKTTNISSLSSRYIQQQQILYDSDSSSGSGSDSGSRYISINDSGSSIISSASAEAQTNEAASPKKKLEERRPAAQVKTTPPEQTTGNKDKVRHTRFAAFGVIFILMISALAISLALRHSGTEKVIAEPPADPEEGNPNKPSLEDLLNAGPDDTYPPTLLPTPAPIPSAQTVEPSSANSIPSLFTPPPPKQPSMDQSASPPSKDPTLGPSRSVTNEPNSVILPPSPPGPSASPSSETTSKPSKQPTPKPSSSPSNKPTIEFITEPNVNIAEGRAFTTSSQPQLAANAFDGDPETRWISGQGSDDEWLEVDLGAVFKLDRVIIDWEYASAKSYDIQVSTDGSSYTTVWSKDDGYAGIGTVESLLGNRFGRYVRMQGRERATDWGYSIWEMSVFGTGPRQIEFNYTPPKNPSLKLSTSPSRQSTPKPSESPSKNPTPKPSKQPTPEPSSSPSNKPTIEFISIANVNIAEGKASSASSQSELSPDAFDGDFETRWISGQGSDDEWLEVDLGAVYQLSRVGINWEYASAKSYDIQVSLDGSSYTTVWSKVDGFAGMGYVISYLRGAFGRYVRMQGRERATDWGYSIWEMEVFGRGPIATGTTGNIADGKVSSASSEPQLADNAFDGDPETRWQSDSGSDDGWLEVDLGAVYQLKSVTIAWEYACAKSYDIQVSIDGSSYTTLWVKNNGFAGMGTVESLLGDRFGRYVRMQGREMATDWGYSIWEMEVFVGGPMSDGT